MVCEVKDTESVKYIFANWQETLIWSCLQGIMGRIYVTDPDRPVSAMAVIGDFIFYAGEPDRELVLYKPSWCEQDFIIMVPQDDRWKPLIEEVYGKKAKPVLRYAIKKEPGIFDAEKLKQAVRTLPEGYRFSMIDEKLYRMCREEDWSADLVSQFKTYEEYRRRGLAYACGVRLILECLGRGLYPSWDAQNKWSVSLAEKLGYHFSHAYDVYEIRGY